MKKYMYDFCLERHSIASALQEPGEEEEEDDHDSGILSDVALLYFLVRSALFFPPLSLRHPLPRLGQLESPPKLLRRFQRGCVVFTAHGLATAPSIVYVHAMTKMIWRKHIVARVMSGFVTREEVRLQAAAAARVDTFRRKSDEMNFKSDEMDFKSDEMDFNSDEMDFIAAAQRGVDYVLSYLIADDACCLNECDWVCLRG